MATELAGKPSDFAGSAYLDLIEQQLDGEQRRKDSLEQRGLALITISGFLAAELFALITWATGKGQPPLSGAVKPFLVASAIAFFLGAVCGLFVIRTKGYEEPKVSELEGLLTESYWGQPAEGGTLSVAEVLFKTLKDARPKNGRKAFWLELGVWCEALAAMALLVGVIAVLA